MGSEGQGMSFTELSFKLSDVKSHKNLVCLEHLEYQTGETEQQLITTEKEKANPMEFLEELISSSANFKGLTNLKD